MSAAVVSQGQLLAQDLFNLIQSLDPAVFRLELEQKVEQLTVQVRARIAEVLAVCHRTQDEQSAAFTEVVESLSQQFDEFLAARRDGAAAWLAFFKSLQPGYDALSLRLGAVSKDIELPELRPTNHARSLVHIGNGFFALVVLQLGPALACQIFAGAFALFAWTSETVRRISPAANRALMKLFGPIAHAHETHKVNSATWYATALLILSFTVPAAYSSVAVIVLGLADPAAAYFGRRYGRVRLINGRSLEGSLAFALVGALSGAVVLALFSPLAPSQVLFYAAVGGVSGALAELVSGRKVDDNLTIPLAVGFSLFALG
ncbi:MAG: hypothetical protein IV100_30240 [Myxococcales bacterium]|nr:hypothetical protein [Myxococcales bacterium]